MALLGIFTPLPKFTYILLGLIFAFLGYSMDKGVKEEVDVPVEEISEVVKKYPEVVWCLDTVSSMGGTKIEVDKLGVDVCLTSSQKALGLPPGIAACSFSKKAVERAKKVEFRR